MSKEFSPLDKESISLLAEDNTLYENYIEALMLLHDLVAPFSITRSHQLCKPEDTKKRLTKLLNRLEDYEGDKTHKTYKIIEKNRDTVEEIAEQAKEILSVEAAYEVQINADKFIDALVQMYSLLRRERKRIKTTPV